MIRVHGGEARRMTDAKGGVLGFRWSPDGTRIAYAATDPVPATWDQKVKEKDDARIVDEQVQRNPALGHRCRSRSEEPEARGLTKPET